MTEVLVPAKQVTQFDLFTEHEIRAAGDYLSQYTATITEYVEQGSVGITPYVLANLVASKYDVSQQHIQLSPDMVRRYLTVFSYNHDTPIPTALIKLDPTTKAIFIAIRLFGGQ